MNKLEAVSRLVDEVISDLNDAGHEESELISTLVQCSSQLHEPNGVYFALVQIYDLCHVKVLGDLNMPNFESFSWLNKAEKLSKNCEKAIKVYEDRT